jgi:hypothetical protein
MNLMSEGLKLIAAFQVCNHQFSRSLPIPMNLRPICGSSFSPGVFPWRPWHLGVHHFAL